MSKLSEKDLLKARIKEIAFARYTIIGNHTKLNADKRLFARKLELQALLKKVSQEEQQ